jgi:hypothetical protein
MRVIQTQRKRLLQQPSNCHTPSVSTLLRQNCRSTLRQCMRQNIRTVICCLRLFMGSCCGVAGGCCAATPCTAQQFCRMPRNAVLRQFGGVVPGLRFGCCN